jgi:diphthamide biosynthesis protein 2
VNAAKVANFSEVEGWVVIGCWESSLIESAEFWKPIITPFELGLCLQRDEERVWTGEWEGDFESVLRKGQGAEGAAVAGETENGHSENQQANGSDATDPTIGEEAGGDGDYDSEEESAPPEFDLRTGRYVSHSRPMRSATAPKSSQSQQSQKNEGSSSSSATAASSALMKRAVGDIAHIGGVASPGAEYLRSKRTWTGLGSDYHEGEEDGSAGGNAARMEEGRRGIARGYVVGDEGAKH